MTGHFIGSNSLIGIGIKGMEEPRTMIEVIRLRACV